MKTTLLIQYHLSKSATLPSDKKSLLTVMSVFMILNFRRKICFLYCHVMQINRNITTAETRFGTKLGHVVFVGDKVTL